MMTSSLKAKKISN